MKLIIVSGQSGSGKSVALNTLEDLNYYCIDNLPVNMLEAFAVEMEQAHPPVEKIAVGIDVRNLSEQLGHFEQMLHALWERGLKYEVMFLKCNRETLIKRFSETRRKHPLSDPDTPLLEAIDKEQLLLAPIEGKADLLIDTSASNIHELRDLVRDRIEMRHLDNMSLLFLSFGFKQGIPNDADYVFDVRCLPNPHWDEQLRPLTGQDDPVIEFLNKQPQVTSMYQQIESFLANWIPAFEKDGRSYLTIAIGCTGGRHRSVHLIEKIGAHFNKNYENVVIRHRELS